MTPFLDEGTRLSNFNGTVAGDASCVVSRQPTKKFNDSSSSSSTSLVQCRTHVRTTNGPCNEPGAPPPTTNYAIV
jgi:hypothetical protein